MGSKDINPILSRHYLKIDLQLQSPLNVSNGVTIETDADVQVYQNGQPFVPGSSVAGAFRDYLSQKKDEDGIFGFSKGKEGRMSPIYISDISFQTSKMIVRDGVRMKYNERTVEDGGKFDMQAVETGTEGSFSMEIICRERDPFSSDEYLERVREILSGLACGDIRFGKKKNRGFGRVMIKNVCYKEFTKTNVNEWLAFSEEPTWTDEDRFVWTKEKNEKFIKICVPLQLNGGLMIRSYSAQPNAADFETLTIENGKKPIIPGSSWNGAIRSDALRILQELGCKNSQTIIDQWFGKNAKDAKNEKNDLEQSMIVIGESIIEASVLMNSSRNQIDRISGGTVTGALFTERGAYGGTTTLEIMVDPKRTGIYLEALLGLLRLVIMDICNGFVAIGGEVSIGRGIFEANSDISFVGVKPNENAWLSALYDLVTGEET